MYLYSCHNSHGMVAALKSNAWKERFGIRLGLRWEYKGILRNCIKLCLFYYTYNGEIKVF